MAKSARVSDRRTDALTRERIVAAAIELLDATGEKGLTFRALALRLETGHGAIQWHIANKSELVKAATAAVVAEALGEIDAAVSPREAIYAGALGIFDAIDAHPWIGAELSRPPWQGTMMDLFELIGRQVQALGTPLPLQFTATTALLHYIIGASGQNATTSQSPFAGQDRQGVLDDLAGQWQQLDPAAFGFTRSVAEQLRSHDDREEFLAGIDLLLMGTTSLSANAGAA